MDSGEVTPGYAGSTRERCASPLANRKAAAANSPYSVLTVAVGLR
jgi:hypothetical protein